MAIIKNGVDYGKAFNIGAAQPIDSRMRVQTKSDLTSVWGAEAPAYLGMIVTVMDTLDVYVLNDKDKWNEESSWVKLAKTSDVKGDAAALQAEFESHVRENKASFSALTEAYEAADAEINLSIDGINAKIGTVAEGKDLATMIEDAKQAAIDAATKITESEEGHILVSKEVVDGVTTYTISGNDIASASAVSASIESLTNAIASAKTEAITSANTYTDGKVSAATEALQGAIDEVSGALKTYTIQKVTEGLAANVEERYQLMENGVQVGDTIDIKKDSSLKEVNLVSEKPSEEGGEATQGQFLKFTYLLNDGSESDVYVDVSLFLAESEFGDGLEVVDGIVKVKVDAASEAFLSVSENGVKVSGVADAIASAKTQAIESASAYTDGKVTELTNAIASAKTEAIETASAYTDGKVTELTNAIASAKTEANNYTDEKFTSASTALNDAISGVTDAFEQADAALLSSITENAEAIEAIDVKLSGVTSVSGAIEAAKTEVKGYTDTQITNAINALDSTVTNGEDATVQVSIEQVDGKVNSVSADLYWGSF